MPPQTGSHAPAFLSIAIVLGFFGCIVLLLFTERTWDNHLTNLMFFVFGSLVSSFERVGTYWMGSSSGSKRSGDTLRSIAEKNAAEVLEERQRGS